MKKPKIQEGIEKCQIAREAELARTLNPGVCHTCWRADCDGSCQANMNHSPDDTPTADLTEEAGTRIKPAEPCLHHPSRFTTLLPSDKDYLRS